MPTKKLFLIGGPLIIAIAIIFSFYNPFHQKSLFTNNGVTVVRETDTLPRFDDIDSDGDGLFDWEEALWGTDPKNQTSDGRNISDNEYVKNLIENPDSQKLSSFGTSTTMTGAFGINFFNEYIALKQSNKLTNETIEDLANRLSNEVLSSGTNKTFTVPPSQIFEDSDTASVQRYGNSVAEIRERYQTEYQRNQISSSDFEVAEKANQAQMNVGNLFTRMANELGALPVPRLAVSIHESLVTSYQQSGEAFYAMANAGTDPMKAVVGLQAYNDATSAEAEAVQNLGRYFAQSGIIFSINEPGSIWSTQ